MNISSYLEAFLTVYGWSVFQVIYFLIAVTGFFLYPLLKGFLALLIEFLSSTSNPYGFVKQVLITLVLVMIVFLITVVPVIPLSFDRMTVGTTCDKATQSVNDANKSGNGTYFAVTSARAPIMPWMAMRLGQGFNKVIYSRLPCALDISDTNNKVLNANVSGSENGVQLMQEYRQFRQQCMAAVERTVNNIRNGYYDNGMQNGKVKTWFEDKFNDAVDAKFRSGIARNTRGLLGKEASQNEQYKLLYFDDSSFVYDMFFSPNSPMITDSTVSTELGGIPGSFRATSAVIGFNDEALPDCGTWWRAGNGSTLPLRERLTQALSDDVLLRVASHSGPQSCRPQMVGGSMGSSAGGPNISRMPDRNACLAEIKNTLGASDDQFTTALLESLQGNTVTDSPISAGESVIMGLAAAGTGALTVIQSIFGIDLGAGQIIGSVVGFYASIWIMKIILTYLIPMVMMTIYMFWGIYMVIGELRGTTMIKGLLLIFSLTSIPGIWHIIDHLDDRLLEAMYGGIINSNPFNAILLDVTSGMFYLISVFVVFYLYSMAGMGDAGVAIRGTHNDARGASQVGASSVGNSAGSYGKLWTLGSGQRRFGGGPIGRWWQGRKGGG